MELPDAEFRFSDSTNARPTTLRDGCGGRKAPLHVHVLGTLLWIRHFFGLFVYLSETGDDASGVRYGLLRQVKIKTLFSCVYTHENTLILAAETTSGTPQRPSPRINPLVRNQYGTVPIRCGKCHGIKCSRLTALTGTLNVLYTTMRVCWQQPPAGIRHAYTEGWTRALQQPLKSVGAAGRLAAHQTCVDMARFMSEIIARSAGVRDVYNGHARPLSHTSTLNWQALRPSLGTLSCLP